MIDINIYDEVSPLETVVLGTGECIGKKPTPENAIDPKSKKHILNDTYPQQEDIIAELEDFRKIFQKYEVQVYRPESIKGLNQVFARDIGIALEDRFIIPNVLSDRSLEINGIKYLIDQFPSSKVTHAPLGTRIEGGDVIPCKGKLFVGYSKTEDFEQYKAARTNQAGIEFLSKNFKDWEIHPFELNKSDVNLSINSLHLDCCFQPIGNGKAIIDRRGFKNKKDVDFLLSFFGEENCFMIDQEKMDAMTSNIFSINPQVIVSEKKFVRLNKWLRKNNFTVEEISYQETSKMGGLFRCTTMPINRRKNIFD